MRRVFKIFAITGKKQHYLQSKLKINMSHGHQDLDWFFKDWQEYNLDEGNSFNRGYIGNVYGLFLKDVEIRL